MPNRQLLLKTSLPDVGKQYGTLWRCHMPDYTETAACYTTPQRNAVFNGLIFCRCWMMFGVPIQPYLLPPINQGDRIEKTIQRLRSWWLGGRLGQGAAALSVVKGNHILDLPPQPRIPVANEGLVVGSPSLKKCNKPGLNPNSYKSPFLVIDQQQNDFWIFCSGLENEMMKICYIIQENQGERLQFFQLPILDFETMNMQMTF